MPSHAVAGLVPTNPAPRDSPHAGIGGIGRHRGSPPGTCGGRGGRGLPGPGNLREPPPQGGAMATTPVGDVSWGTRTAGCLAPTTCCTIEPGVHASPNGPGGRPVTGCRRPSPCGGQGRIPQTSDTLRTWEDGEVWRGATHGRPDRQKPQMSLLSAWL